MALSCTLQRYLTNYTVIYVYKKCVYTYPVRYRNRNTTVPLKHYSYLPNKYLSRVVQG